MQGIRRLDATRCLFISVIFIALVAQGVVSGQVLAQTKAACANSRNPYVRNNPPAPKPETVVLERVPLPPPPVNGVCDLKANTQGCISSVDEPGGFIDPQNVTAEVTFAGAPGSVFSGHQLIAIRTDGSKFSNGMPWKCITCEIPAPNHRGVAAGSAGGGDYSQPFHDGHDILLGNTIIHCDHSLASDACTPENIYRYPIRWNGSPDGSGRSRELRELRIHPDGVHLGGSHFVMAGGRLDEFMYYGRLVFDPDPESGEPRVPRYDFVNVNQMYDPDEPGTIWPDPKHPGELKFSPLAPQVGEFKGWSKDGKWAAYLGFPSQSSNIDIFMRNLETGEVRQITRNPSYSEPIDISYDNQWFIVEDTRDDAPELFLSAMPGIPSLTDLLTTGVVSSVRDNNRFPPSGYFQPILIDIYGDRGAYQGQSLKRSCPEGEKPGGLCDHGWNAVSDPRISPDDTEIVYGEFNYTGANYEPGGRNTRLVIARLVDRKPFHWSPPPSAADVVPWAKPYKPGDPEPYRASMVPPAGVYKLRGKSGYAVVTITLSDKGTRPLVTQVAAVYHDFSLDGLNVINGSESVTRLPISKMTAEALEWHSNLNLSGCHHGTKVTGKDGYRVRTDVLKPTGGMTTSGTMVTTIDGVSYRNPQTAPF